jgi:NAD+ synthase (glutamine-hydrolysing)
MKKSPTISIAQMKSIPMDLETNLQTMRQMIEEAKRSKTDIIVFPELCVSGYVLGDRFENVDFVTELQQANERIRAMSEGIVVIWGNIIIDESKIGEDGRIRKYNAACIAQNGSYVSNGVLIGYIPKNNLPKYRIFDDARHFYPAYKLAEEQGHTLQEFFKPFIVSVQGEEYSLALTVCEDLWEDEYTHKVSQLYKSENPDLLVDISASPWTLSKWKARERMLYKRVAGSGIPILYVNGVGLQNNGKNLIWFDGSSALVDRSGVFIFRAPSNQEGVYTTSIAEIAHHKEIAHIEEIEELYNALTASMKAFYEPLGTIVIGLSGGIDSAVSLALLRQVFPPEKVIAVNMPTRFNSKTTRSLAELCANNFGVNYYVVSIDKLFTEQVNLLESTFKEPLTTLTKENIQSRLRGAQGNEDI